SRIQRRVSRTLSRLYRKEGEGQETKTSGRPIETVFSVARKDTLKEHRGPQEAKGETSCLNELQKRRARAKVSDRRSARCGQERLPSGSPAFRLICIRPTETIMSPCECSLRTAYRSAGGITHRK